MPKITFVDFEGTERVIEGTIGDSLMEAATTNDVPGIDADCGGACACATCHVYVAQEWTSVVGKPEDLEAEMLDVAEDVKENSRLSCQVKLTQEMDGLIITTPESQF